MLLIENQGQAIVSTNYWDSEQAQAGLLFLSWNAGAGRVLVPDNRKHYLREMKGAREVLVSRGPWEQDPDKEMWELLWEDDSDDPFAVHLETAQIDRLLPDADQGAGFAVAVWTRGGMKGRWPGRYRRVEEVPWLKPWVDH